MDITIHSTFLPHNDPEPSLAFYRDTLGFEVRIDVGTAARCAGSPSVLPASRTPSWSYPPAADPGITDDERRIIAEMMAKGTYAHPAARDEDLDATFEQVQASDAEVVQEPTEQPYGVRDCAFRTRGDLDPERR